MLPHKNNTVIDSRKQNGPLSHIAEKEEEKSELFNDVQIKIAFRTQCKI
jgi:hypothetical protein